MRNISTKAVRNVGLAILAALLLALVLIAFMTYNANPAAGGFLAFAVAHHMEIMAALVLIAIIFGFVSSKLFYAEILREKQETKNILGIVFLFLNHEERAIINLLVENGGKTSQAEVSRLPGMNRVKAHRSLQKMQEKQLIELVAHGKVRKVSLKENVLTLLTEKN